MNKQIKLVFLLLIFFIQVQTYSKTQEKVFPTLPKVFSPNEKVIADQSVNKKNISPFSQITQIILFLLFLTMVAYMIVRKHKKGDLLSINKKKNSQLKILETKLLGNRQYIILIEINGTKKLIGVSHNQINCLGSL